jgi:hypothetical protein
MATQSPTRIRATALIDETTLIVHGDRDRFFPAEMAIELYRGIPASRL